MVRSPKTIGIGIVAILMAIILLQNTEVVTLRFLFWQLSMSRIILIPLILMIGLIIGYILGKNSW